METERLSEQIAFEDSILRQRSNLYAQIKQCLGWLHIQFTLSGKAHLLISHAIFNKTYINQNLITLLLGNVH